MVVVQVGEAVEDLPAPLLHNLTLHALRLLRVLLERARRHDLRDKDDLLPLGLVKHRVEAQDVLVIEALEDLGLLEDLTAHVVPAHPHVDLAPGDLDPLLAVVRLVDHLGGAVPQHVVEALVTAVLRALHNLVLRWLHDGEGVTSAGRRQSETFLVRCKGVLDIPRVNMIFPEYMIFRQPFIHVADGR
eukprot:4457307-Prymnesium_polylepis.1